ncbi:MAG: DMT family transporter, partial [Planctomycetota bacterium]|nr:DMT family transporter [Planctomycetota bacterium]
AGIGLLVVSSHVQAEGSWAFRGDALVLGGTIVWSIQSIYEKRILPNYRPFTIVVWQIALSSVVMWILWAIFEREQAVVLNTRTISAFLYMVFPVTIFVYLTYMYVLQYMQVSTISYFNFVMTVSGVLLGVLILGEPITLPLVLSMLLVSGGVVLVMRPDSEDRHRDVAPTVPT